MYVFREVIGYVLYELLVLVVAAYSSYLALYGMFSLCHVFR